MESIYHHGMIYINFNDIKNLALVDEWKLHFFLRKCPISRPIVVGYIISNRFLVFFTHILCRGLDMFACL